MGKKFGNHQSHNMDDVPEHVVEEVLKAANIFKAAIITAAKGMDTNIFINGLTKAFVNILFNTLGHDKVSWNSTLKMLIFAITKDWEDMVEYAEEEKRNGK